MDMEHSITQTAQYMLEIGNNDEKNGHGVETFPDGSKYDGNFVNGKNQGKGVFTWPDGSKYTGDFIQNDLEGDGVYVWADGRMYT